MMRHRAMMVGLGVMVWGILSLSVTIAPATADLVRFQFVGQLTTVDPFLQVGTGISVGNSFIGTYTFDSNATGSPLGPTATRYHEAIARATASIGTNQVLSSSLPSSSSITIVDSPSVPPAGVDYYRSISFFPPSQVENVNGFRLEALDLGLVDPLATAFNNSFLPSTPPTISAFASKPAFFVFRHELGGNYVAWGGISSLTAVPVPAAVLLFGTGLTALIGLGAGSWRRKLTRVA